MARLDDDLATEARGWALMNETVEHVLLGSAGWEHVQDARRININMTGGAGRSPTADCFDVKRLVAKSVHEGLSDRSQYLPLVAIQQCYVDLWQGYLQQ